MSSYSSPQIPLGISAIGSTPLSYMTASTADTSDSFGIPLEEYRIPKSFYFSQLSNLYNEQLYSSVLSLGSFVITLAEKLKDSILTEVEHVQVTTFCGESAFRLNDFPRAENFYKKAIQMYKSMSKCSPHLKDQLPVDFHNDLRYKVYLCQMQCKKPTEALTTLQSIPAKQRTVRINMALGKLYLQTGMERAAITSFKEVLKECPMAMDASEALMSLGLKETDIQNIVHHRTQDIVYGDWFNSWLRASAAFHTRDYVKALNVYSHLQEKTALQNNHTLLVAIGTTYAMTGDYQSGISPLRVAHMNDCCNFDGMELLAFLLWAEKRTTELEKLAYKLLDYNYTETKSEPYLAMAYYCQITNRNPKGLHFAEKAVCIQGVKSPEALICKGNIYLDMKNSQGALPCFREASTLFPNRFEPQKGIFDCYMAMKRYRDAMAIATAGLKQLGQSARVLTMCAQPLTKDPLTMAKAKAYLDKALNLDNEYLPAIFMLVDILEQEGKLTGALNFLMQQVESRLNPPSVHIRVANLLVNTGNEDKASDHFAIALKLDPNSREAREGLMKLDPSARPAHEAGFLMEEIGIDDDEEDPEEHKRRGVSPVL